MMFGNAKNLEKEIKVLREKNKELVGAMEEMAKPHSTDFVVKLIPECSDQFYIDGEFVADDCKAVYGSHQLSFSEAVCWKAGKEVAKRAYESLLAEAERDVRKSSSSSKGSYDRAEALQKELDDVKKEYASDLEILKGFRERCQILEGNITVLRNEVESLTEKLQAAESGRTEYYDKYSAAKEQLDKLTAFEPSETVFTSCGAVVSTK